MEVARLLAKPEERGDGGSINPDGLDQNYQSALHRAAGAVSFSLSFLSCFLSFLALFCLIVSQV